MHVLGAAQCLKGLTFLGRLRLAKSRHQRATPLGGIGPKLDAPDEESQKKSDNYHGSFDR